MDHERNCWWWIRDIRFRDDDKYGSTVCWRLQLRDPYMQEQYLYVWIAFFVILSFLGFSVAVFPFKVSRSIGAPAPLPRSWRLSIWRGLGWIVMIGSIVELAKLFATRHR